MTARATEQVWAERVRSWRDSGESAETFAEGKGYAGSTLRFWASRLGRSTAPRVVQLVPKSQTAGSASTSDIELEVSGVRVRVRHGFDRELLGEVIGLLRERAR